MKINKREYSINIGRGVGNDLEDLLLNAKKRIWIVSPWISKKYASLLLKKHQEGVDVKLITTTSYNNTKHIDAVNSLIGQKALVDKDAFLEFKKNRNLIGGVCGLFFFLSLIAKSLFFFFLSAFLLTIYFTYKKNVGCYEYNSPFPLKVCKTIYSDHCPNDFIHSKIYLIDNSGAVGSANLTEAGLWNNVETFVTLKNKEVVVALEKEFEMLFKHPLLSEKNLQELGEHIYQTHNTSLVASGAGVNSSSR
ncbi:MAG: phosphatidylserine/phosphatidylglycerophosphate/cardiolipin synthase family protein [Candidatus Aenigmarchaeota archaeon]|nr:phosphatidylserine/phosphatidylglycerophosphate/cardiolipin synthase family protein [Candidatus Aenigmarchaeota archaeon]